MRNFMLDEKLLAIVDVDEMVVPLALFSAKQLNLLFTRQVWGIWRNKVDNITHTDDRE